MSESENKPQPEDLSPIDEEITADMVEVQNLYWNQASYFDPELQEFLAYLMEVPGVAPKFGTGSGALRYFYPVKSGKPAYLRSKQGLHAIRQNFERQKDQKERVTQQITLKTNFDKQREKIDDIRIEVSNNVNEILGLIIDAMKELFETGETTLEDFLNKKFQTLQDNLIWFHNKT